MTEEVYTHVPEHMLRHTVPDSCKHPKKCPSCFRPWEFESSQKHACIYCGHRILKTRFGEILVFITNFVPLVVWIASGLLLLLILGRHYNG